MRLAKSMNRFAKNSLAASSVTWSPAVGPDDFYQDKTVRLIVMTSPGGGYDTYTRAIARFFGKHIPGNPSVIVQNMPGARKTRWADNSCYQ